MPDGLGVWIIGALLIGFALMLLSRFAHRNPYVKRTSWGFYVERSRYDEDAGLPEPLPPATPPPPPPPDAPALSEKDTRSWPVVREDS